MKTDATKKYQYAVVLFVELPGAGIDDYVCIPRSWIQKRTERKVRVAYPSERPSVTKKRIKIGENPLDNWKRYMAVIKLEAATYKQAKKFVMQKKCNTPTSELCPSVINNGTENNRCLLKRACQTEINVKKLNVADKDEVAAMSSSSKPPESSNNKPSVDVTIGSPSCSNDSQPFRYRYLQQIHDLSFRIKDISSEIGCERSVRELPRTAQDFFRNYPGPLKTKIPRGLQNPVLLQIMNLPSQHNQISTTSPVRQDDAQVFPTGKVSVEQSSAACRTNDTPASCNRPINTLCSTSAEQNESSQLDDGGDSRQDSDMQPIIVDGSSEADSDSSAVASSPENTGQSTGCTMEDRSLTIDKVYTGKVSSTQDKDDDDDVDNDDDGSSSPGESAEETGANQQADQSIKPEMELMDHRANQVTDMRELKLDFVQPSEIFCELQKQFDKVKKMLETIEKGERIRPEAGNQGADSDKGDEDEGESSNNVRNKDQDDNENKDKEASRRACETPRSFVLPPEYDPNDSRWTLKYHKKDSAPGLVELVPGSNVFVDYFQLSHCKRMAKDSKALARMLLVKIFTQSALSVCSLTGARANAFYNNGSDVRPGLNENARVVMLSYVEDYTREKNWGPYNGQSVINSLRSKIHEIRYRRCKTK